MVSKTIQADEALSEDVVRFAQEHLMVDHVQKAILATREVFMEAERIVVSLKRDPEFDDINLNINAVIPEYDPDLEAEKYADCLGKWASFMPPKVLGIISLSTSETQ
jgi:hypothetical protein